ncbi:MAG TPA: hypothetical protein VGB55_03600 [Tepidisphaeraceae bacterium]|jgi:hypothetical protein
MSIAAPLIRRWFDLPDRAPAPSAYDEALLDRLLPQAGRITLVTGPSGGGKSSLLTALRRRHGKLRWVGPNDIALPNQPVIDCVTSAIGGEGEAAVLAALEAISRVGMAEAWTYLQTPAQLSDGQRWRLILALCLITARRAQAVTIIEVDEFAALLDRVTAAVVARSLRRLIDTTPLIGAVVVTSHDDLALALKPDVQITCDFGTTHIDGRVAGSK